MSGRSVRVAVFVDWQNVYLAAREAFSLEGTPAPRGNFSPFRLGQLLAAANGRGPFGKLVCVEVHRGIPSQRRDKVGYTANRRQQAAWRAEDPQVVAPKVRPLRYRPKQPPTEKGVDVAIAVGAIEATLTRKCDVAIIFSHDNDLLPAPEAIARLVGLDRVETASWVSPSFQRRLRTKAPVVHHAIPQRVFEAVETPINYARSGRS